MKNKNYNIATLASEIFEKTKIANPNIVKVAMTKYKSNIFRAIYFSRAPIPFGSKKYYEHVGIYGYKPEALKNFISCKSSKLEQSEKLEQLRVLENSENIFVGIIKNPPISIDTPKDLKKLKKKLNKRKKS